MVSGKTKILGIIGWPIGHSYSPLIHNAAFQELGLEYCYVPLPVERDLEGALRGFKAMGFIGGNVTIPYKEKIMPYLDEISPEANLIGAVNTLRIEHGKLVGYNTDGTGFVRSLKEEAAFDPKGKRFVLLGGGGAARGIAVALALAGCHQIALVNRSLDGPTSIKKILTDNFSCEVGVFPWEEEVLAELLRQTDCLINTTPLGMYPNHQMPSIIPAQILPSGGLMVADIVYNPRMTSLLQTAQDRGNSILSGEGMLLYQGIIGFELWTGQKAPIKVMKEKLLKKLQNP